MQGSGDYYHFHERCIFCDMVKEEIADQTRVVVQSERFLAFEPFAPRFPFETWIVPLEHSSHFESMDPATDEGKARMTDLADILKATLAKIEQALDRPPYNYVIHSAPFDVGEVDQYHWHVEVIPRVTRVAGFEWGTGFYINPVPPEDAAEFLRKL
jgi:UDPglucose--hexose-1-phosphate uridylyltransferase